MPCGLCFSQVIAALSAGRSAHRAWPRHRGWMLDRSVAFDKEMAHVQSVGQARIIEWCWRRDLKLAGLLDTGSLPVQNCTSNSATLPRKSVSRRLNISEARSKLPELAKFLAQHSDQVILVEHRDLEETIALTTEGHLRYLETAVKELKKQICKPFKLAGSITSQLSDEELEEALKELREEQARLGDQKLRDLAS